jgi:hypothetical protein
LPFHHNSKLCVRKDVFSLRAEAWPITLLSIDQAQEGHHDCKNNYRHGCGSDNGWLSLRG